MIIAEDFILVQDAMRLFLEPDVEVVAVADDGQQAIDLAANHRPDILLVDVSLPLVSGFEVAQEVRSIDPNIRVIFVTAYAEGNYVRRALEVGARGYVLKPSARTELPIAIAQAMCGSVYLSPGLAERAAHA